MSPRLSLRHRVRLLAREIFELRRLQRTPPDERQLIFYVAQAQYYAYFQGVIQALINKRLTLTYLTSDYRDPLLQTKHKAINSFYLNRLFPFTAPFLQAKVIVLTMPDLHQLHIRRSIHDVHYIFMFHSMCSSHMGLNKGALDHFDTIFCNGPYHFNEIKATENIYQLPQKTLVKAGYYRLENLYAAHQTWKKNNRTANDQPLIVIAPSWQKENILESCGTTLVAALLAADYEIVFRPHPMTTYRKPQQLRMLAESFDGHPRFKIDTKTESNYYLHQADLLICDWSGVAMEYALATERPVLFIDLPPKIHNPEYEKIGLPPLEMEIRSRIGKVIPLEEAPFAAAHVGALLAEKEAFCTALISARKKHLYNFGNSAEVSAGYIRNLLQGGS